MITHAMIDIREVSRRTGLGRKAISARMDPWSSRFDPTFPMPIKQGRFMGWVEAEVDAYVVATVRDRRTVDDLATIQPNLIVEK